MSRDQASPCDTQEPEGISETEAETVEERSRLPAPLIYEIVRRMGRRRWNGRSLRCGGRVSPPACRSASPCSFSLLAQAILQAHLPDTLWRPLLTSLGYPVGFLIVVLACQQLFTENTITPVLPLAANFTAANLAKLARLWTIVFAANMTGTAAAAVFCTLPPVLAPELRDVMIDISRHILQTSWIESFFRAISAGFLIAAMVWLIPSGEAAAFHVIAMMTYLIGIGGFLHIYCRQRRSLFAGCQRAAQVGAYDAIFCLARPARKYRRRHCALHVDVACPGDERDPNSTGSPPAAAVKL